MTDQDCPCACHGQSSTFGSCSVAGGCGHLHKDDPSMRCCRGLRCADARARTVHDENGEPKRQRYAAWAVTPNGMCRICTQLTQRAIEQLPADHTELGELLGKALATLEPSTGGTRELPVPIRLNIEALQAAILDEVERWAAAVAESTGFWFYGTGTRLDRLGYGCGWLGGLFDRFLNLPPTEQHRFDPTEECLSGKDSTVWTSETGLDGALRLLALHEQVTAVAGRTHRAHKAWIFCPDCKRLTLEHPEGANHVECRRCGYRMPYDVYDDMSRLLAARHENDPVPERERRTVELPPDEPLVWFDGSEHTRVDTTSNMMLGYVQRHSDVGESAA